MSLDLALSIARSGLATVQRNIALAGQNVANANTPGYTRKTLPLDAADANGQPLGVRSRDVQRSVDAALVGRLDQSRSAAAGATVREQLLRDIETAHSQGTDGQTLADTVSDLRKAFITLRGAPADTAQQAAAATAAADVSQRLNQVGGAVLAARQAAQDGLVQEVANINATLRDISAISNELRTNPGNAATLEDRLDAALAKLSQSVDVRTIRQADGGLMLLTKGGTVLPLDPKRDALAITPAILSPSSAAPPAGSLPGITMDGIDVTSSLQGGRIGEYVGLRDTLLPRYQAEVDQVASQLATRFDQQGLRLFTDSDGSVPDTSLPYAGSAQVGFSLRIRVNPAAAADPAVLRDGTQAIAGSTTGASAFTPNPAGGPNGFTDLLDRVLNYSFGAEAQPGVAWPAIPTSGLGPSGALSSPFATAPRIEDYATRVAQAQVGDRAAATAAKDQATALTKTLEDRVQTQSGVDIDTEMAGMVTLQNAYAANARVLGTVQTMWDQLLAAVR